MAFTSGFDDNELGNGGPDYGSGCQRRSGWWENTGGSTGGDINTGFKRCYLLIPIPHANGTAYVNESSTVPMDGSAVTIVTTADIEGKWIAWGD
jgi:hypothetical protein